VPSRTQAKLLVSEPPGSPVQPLIRILRQPQEHHRPAPASICNGQSRQARSQDRGSEWGLNWPRADPPLLASSDMGLADREPALCDRSHLHQIGDHPGLHTAQPHLTLPGNPGTAADRLCGPVLPTPPCLCTNCRASLKANQYIIALLAEEAFSDQEAPRWGRNSNHGGTKCLPGKRAL
jgi:hypothetical protein